MESLELVKLIAGYAGTSKAEPESMSYVHFRDGVVFADSLAGTVYAFKDFGLKASVRAKHLLKAIKAVGDDATVKAKSFKRGGDKLELSGGGAKASVATITTVPTVPSFQGFEGSETAPEVLAVSRLEGFISKDSSRPGMGGARILSDRVEATNGHIGGIVRGSFGNVMGLPENGVIVPSDLMRGLVGDEHAVVHEGRLMLHSPSQGLVRSCRLIDGLFPAVDSVYTALSASAGISVDRAELVDLIKRVRLSATYAWVTLTKTSLSLRAGENRESTLFEFASSIEGEVVDGVKGPDPKVNSCIMDLRYLDLLVRASQDDSIQIRMGGALDPLYVVDEFYQGVGMPTRP